MRRIAFACLCAAVSILAACHGSGFADSSLNSDPAIGLGSTLAPEGCADMLHQDRPGGSDYQGPPVPGC